MTCRAEALTTLIARIYDCGAEREQWQALLAELAALMHADKAHIFCPVPGPAQESFWVGHGISPQELGDYRSYYHTRDVLTHTASNKSLFVAGRALADGAITDKRLLKRSEFYHDFWRPDGILHSCAGIIFDQHSSPIPVTLLGLYSGSERPPFSRKEERLVELLIPHLQRALRMALQIDGARMLSAVREGLFDASPYAMAICSRDGQLLYGNSRMERLLEGRDGLTVRAGRLEAHRHPDGEALMGALAACAAPPGLTAPRDDPLPVRRPSGKAPYSIRVHRLPSWHRSLGLGMQAVAWLQITDPAERPRDVTEPLRRLYGLTPAESRLVAALARGDTPKAAAERFQVTENTIRTQLKSVLAKTGARRQVDLVLLVNRLAVVA